jgi:hypothetical protein
VVLCAITCSATGYFSKIHAVIQCRSTPNKRRCSFRHVHHHARDSMPHYTYTRAAYLTTKTKPHHWTMTAHGSTRISHDSYKVTIEGTYTPRRAHGSTGTMSTQSVEYEMGGMGMNSVVSERDDERKDGIGRGGWVVGYRISLTHLP